MSAVGHEESHGQVDLEAQMAEVVEAVHGYHEAADVDLLWRAFRLGRAAMDVIGADNV